MTCGHCGGAITFGMTIRASGNLVLHDGCWGELLHLLNQFSPPRPYLTADELESSK